MWRNSELFFERIWRINHGSNKEVSLSVRSTRLKIKIFFVIKYSWIVRLCCGFNYFQREHYFIELNSQCEGIIFEFRKVTNFFA